MERHIVHQNATSPDLFVVVNILYWGSRNQFFVREKLYLGFIFDSIKAIELQMMKSY